MTRTTQLMHSLLVVLLAAAAQPSFAQRMNAIQTLHAQNSHHVCPSYGGPVRAILTNPASAPVIAPLGDLGAMDYTMPPVADLLGKLGVRSLEFDLVYDNVGGSFTNRAIPALAVSTNIFSDTSEIKGPENEFKSKGWKVASRLHLDYLSTCYTLKSCLKQVQAWTTANPGHMPIYIRLQPQHFNFSEITTADNLAQLNTFLLAGLPLTGGPPSMVGTPAPARSHLTAMEREILSVFPVTQIFTPNNFTDVHANQQTRILTVGWPSIQDLAGKVIFMLSAPSPYIRHYQRLYPNTTNALMFIENFPTSAVRRDPSTVFVQMEGVETGGGKLATTAPVADRVASFKKECTRLAKTFMVRAPADTNLVQARNNDFSGRDAAISAGAHFIDTAYPNGHTSACSALTSTYTVKLNGEGALLASTCNPVTRPKSCAAVPPPETCLCYKTA